eukprot:1208537-Prorocentrum_lima.AAC.1
MASVPPAVRDFDNRFSLMLLKSLPEKMKGRVFEETEGIWGWIYQQYMSWILCGRMVHQGDSRNCRA